MALIIFVNLIALSSVLSFNLDYEYTVTKKGPKDSLFGFSVLQHKENSNNWLVIGAPTGVNEFLNTCSRCTDKLSGTVYKCNASDPSLDCLSQIRFDSSPSSPYESKTNQWLGVSLKSGGESNEVLTCAHRYVSKLGGKYSQVSILGGVCHKVDSSLIQGVGKINPCGNLNTGGASTETYKRFSVCQAGIGIDVYPTVKNSNDEMEMLFGAVGALQAEGKIFRDKAEDRQEMWLPSVASFDDSKYYSYFGYSIALGKFIDSNLEVAVGGPRYQSYGKVLIYKDKQFIPVGERNPSNTVTQIPLDYNKDKIEIGSGFGIAVASIDSDNDGFDELIVGAPFTSYNKRPNVGAVYVYGRSFSGVLELKTRFNGDLLQHSTFGYSVANAGDLNLDGYPDLIVGAPHKDVDKGAVFVYQGTNKGFADAPQVIKASEVRSGLASAGALGLQGFGRSLAGGLDLDNNGYKDVLVGSYISGHAVLLRSRPIIVPHTSMTFSPSLIDTSNLNCDKSGVNGPKRTFCFQLSFCHNITETTSSSSTKSIPIKFKLTADAEMGNNPRVLIKDSNVHEFTITSSTTNSNCYQIKDMYLKFDQDGTIAEYPDVKFTISHEIPYGEKKGVDKPKRGDSSVPNLDQYPILSRSYRDGNFMETSVEFTQLKFKRECVKCIPNLKITSPSSNYTLRPGNNDFPFNITIENIGEDPAYAVTLKFKLPKNLFATQVTDSRNKNKQCLNGTCENIIPKLPKKEKRMFTLFLNTQKVRPEDKYQIEFTVSSINDEKKETLKDNTLVIGFDTKVVADIELLAVKSNQQIPYTGTIKGEKAMKNLDEVGSVVNHKFAVRNNGPDTVPSANLTIHWPYETLSGKHLLYLVVVDKGARTICDPIDTNVANIKSGTAPGNLVERRRRDVAPASNQTAVDETDGNIIVKPVLKPKNGITLDCRENTAKCVVIKCRMSNIPSQDSEAITIRSRLWEPSLLLDYYGEVLTVTSYGSVTLGQNASYLNDPNPKNNVNELFTVINPVLVKPKKEIAVWIIALAVVAGIILLALLIFGLFKLGFFKRNRKPEYRGTPKEPEKSLLSD